MYTVRLAKEAFKFSCSHFTIFSSTNAERLHGHNYAVAVEVDFSKTDPHLGIAEDFNAIKPLIKKICDELDERILVPANSPYVQIESDSENMRVSFGTKKYSFPLADTMSLPLLNISSEELARHVAVNLHSALQGLKNWTHLRVQVEETRGQSVTVTLAR